MQTFARKLPTARSLIRSGIVLFLFSLGSATSIAAEHRDLRNAITLFAPFDQSTDARFAKGDPKVYWAESMKTVAQAKPGLAGENVAARLIPNAGRFGDALRFEKKTPHIVFFRGKDNMSYEPKNWSGTVSFWLRASPAELENGYCDPIQITPRGWNDAAFFVEFEKRPDSVPFRLGVYSDFKVWNPQNRKWEEIPFSEKPLLEVTKPPFQGDRWTHVLFTFANFNTGQKNSSAKLYLNGEYQDEIKDREQTFTWDPNEARIMLGLSYIGFYDELAIFNRALTEPEIRAVYQLPKGIRTLVE